MPMDDGANRRWRRGVRAGRRGAPWDIAPGDNRGPDRCARCRFFFEANRAGADQGDGLMLVEVVIPLHVVHKALGMRSTIRTFGHRRPADARKGRSTSGASQTGLMILHRSLSRWG